MSYQAGVLLGQLFLDERVDDAAKGQGDRLDHGRKGVEQVDDEHVDARRAIAGGAWTRASDAPHGRCHCCESAPECGEMKNRPEAG